ncbi:tetratricopeptide repeat protein [archaeon]|nr:MAG: tetratricopeptide repeat protein [archaeon]
MKVFASTLLISLLIHKYLCFVLRPVGRGQSDSLKCLFYPPVLAQNLLASSVFALNYATPATAMSAEDLNSKIQRVLTLHKSGNIPKAIEGYRSLIPKVSPQIQLSLRGNLGALLMAEGDYEGAKDEFTSAVAISPNHASSQYNLAVLLTSKFNQHAKALKHCALAIRADPSAHKAYHLMGNIMQNLGKHEEAAKYFEQAEAIAQEQGVQISNIPSNSTCNTYRSIAELLGFNMEPGDVLQHTIAGVTYNLECLSVQPLILSVGNLIEAEDCEHIIHKSQHLLEKSFVMGNNLAVYTTDTSGESAGNASGVESELLYRSSYTAWLPRDTLLTTIQQKLAVLLNIPLAYIQHKSEDLQVVKYNLGGQFKAHQDSSAFHPRLFTALIYLNNIAEGYAGGETWFPFADSGISLDKVGIEEAIHQALEIYEGREEDRALLGLKVVPKAGRALVFFNYDIKTNELSPYAIHAGLPVYPMDARAANKGEVNKWIANYWVENSPSLLVDLLQGKDS